MSLKNKAFLRRKSITQKYRINDKIRVPEVRLIDEDGKNLGVITISEALQLAEESELDLVEVSPDADPPVCRILNYGKLKYQQKKKTQQKRKPKIQQKEIRIRPRISEHDMQIKLKQAKDFLSHGDKVLFTLSFRGREMAHLDPGRELMEKIGLALEEVAKVEKTPKLEGRKMCMMVIPKGL
ncbi:MAG: translation initiation factor IF-3 [Planctomycetes bacterium]|mgnify:CR=1 FL=1|jgi:translation initiation factor IF-3|nr:translation initiation factor IF-3 [Planctomycetota bacterium]HNZ66262.1 translation initiation factor IF-3 [Planctomycetota bacterium]HON45582.1 translation initiation factor IF-3 [Planctomycetota bacterium]HPY74384.1 translation initiation factor IF-3 [Planctomycetota bacterium]HQA99956.1 translation initiation factor IF-3 [Planctomycetota bacterium]